MNAPLSSELPPSVRYLGASCLLGITACWASENLFWFVPPPGLTVGTLAIAFLPYALACAAALSAVVYTGVTGARAVFLGGALMGFGVEGAVVGTMYEAFPLQLVWTPLAWHAVLSASGVLGASVLAARGPRSQRVGLYLFATIFLVVWGWYWPTERPDLPSLPKLVAYLFGYGLIAVLSLCAALRLLPLAPSRLLWLGPLGIGLAFVIGTLASPSPVRLAGPVLVALTLATMRMHRSPAPTETIQLPPTRLWPLPLAALTAAIVDHLAWPHLGARATNVPIALLSGAIGAGAFIVLVVQGVRRAMGGGGASGIEAGSGRR